MRLTAELYFVVPGPPARRGEQEAIDQAYAAVVGIGGLFSLIGSVSYIGRGRAVRAVGRVARAT